MMRSLWTVALLSAYATAYDGMPQAAAATTVMTHMVTVGGVEPTATPGQAPGPKLSFCPDTVMAAPGDIVRFNFMQKNHSVAQSTFDEPCVDMAGGVQSGFMPNPDGTVPAPIFDFEVKDTKPVWMYCQQTGHCGKGMVFAVNPQPSTGQPGDKSFENFQQMAMSINGTAMAAAATATTASAQQQQATESASVTAAMAPPAGSGVVAQGSGTSSAGGDCACQCLCGMNAFPTSAGVGQFGGWIGQMPTSSAGGAAPTGMTAARRGLLQPPLHRLKQA